MPQRGLLTNNMIYFSQGEVESVKIFDQQGKSVLETNDVSNLDVSNLIDGFYVVQVNNEGVLYQTKFLKETK